MQSLLRFVILNSLANIRICEKICDLKLVNVIINQNMSNTKQIEFILIPQLGKGKFTVVWKRELRRYSGENDSRNV